MRNVKSRVISLVLVLAMVLSLAPVKEVYADAEQFIVWVTLDSLGTECGEKGVVSYAKMPVVTSSATASPHPAQSSRLRRAGLGTTRRP